jgi:hypothetical protein
MHLSLLNDCGLFIGGCVSFTSLAFFYLLITISPNNPPHEFIQIEFCTDYSHHACNGFLQYYSNDVAAILAWNLHSEMRWFSASPEGLHRMLDHRYSTR